MLQVRTTGQSRQLLRGVAASIFLFMSPAFAADAPPADKATEVSDPLEVLNRWTSGLNDFLRTLVIDPMVDLYQGVTPDPVQNAVSNAARNLSEPITAGSSLLQGDVENAKAAGQRFLINSTVGIGGLRDQATEMGIESRPEDLGQALGKHGIAPGPHIVLPLLGPSNLRDATGTLATAVASPLPLAAGVATAGVRYSDHQDDIRAIRDGALDRYTAERETYERYREAQVRDGAPGPVPAIEFAETPAAETGVQTK